MFTVKFYQGDYKARQELANADKCIAYVEHHFNNINDDSAGYPAVVVARNASQQCFKWGRSYAQLLIETFGIPGSGDKGVNIGGLNGMSDSSLKFAAMPAILVEPFSVINPNHAQWIKSDEGRQKLAEILRESIKENFPDGGLIGFSVGHKYKKSTPQDKGAPLCGGGYEADFAEMVLKKAEELMMSQ
jgi:N-acetylmuramoyl-L-alanine amidase